MNHELKEEIAERKRAEEALRESEDRFSNAFEHASIGMALVALDGHWLQVNHALSDIVGYSQQELLALTFQDLTHPDDLEIDLPHTRRLIAGEVRSYELEKRYLHKLGHIIWGCINVSLVRDPEGNPLYFIAQIQNITDRKHAEQTLRDSESRFRSVTESANDAIISADSSGKIVSWNRGARTIFGYNDEEALGQSLSMLMPERYRSDHDEGMRRVNTTGETHVIGATVELHGLHKDGSEFPIELSLASWHSDNDTFYSGIIRDITERKQVEHRITNLNADLERRVAERTAELEAINNELASEISERELAEEERAKAVHAREELFFVISHDLKNPLGAIKGTAQLILKRADEMRPRPDTRIIEGIKRIETSAAKMNMLINELLDFARLQANQSIDLQRANVDLVSLARQSVDEYRGITRHHITLETTLPALTGYWDAFRIERVLANLLSNAIKYNPPGKITITIEREGHWAIMSVQDKGAGIPATELPHIFEWFRRAENISSRISGAGIGLASSRQAVEQHGGTLTVQSKEGIGSTFTVRLPLGSGEKSREAIK